MPLQDTDPNHSLGGLGLSSSTYACDELRFGILCSPIAHRTNASDGHTYTKTDGAPHLNARPDGHFHAATDCCADPTSHLDARPDGHFHAATDCCADPTSHLDARPDGHPCAGRPR